MTKLRVGAAQLGAIQAADDRRAVLLRLLALLDQAKERGVELLVFPELDHVLPPAPCERPGQHGPVVRARDAGSGDDGYWKTTTFVGGLTTRGFLAPYVLDRPINGAVFKAWIEQRLAPELRPGDLVIMDNLAAHNVDGIAQAITARAAELRYLPPYSPDLNPIEQAFAKLKALLRQAALRTVDGPWNAIGQLLDRFPTAACANYLANAGDPRSA